MYILSLSDWSDVRRKNCMAMNSALELTLEESFEEKRLKTGEKEQSAPQKAFRERIKIVGVGGGGCNALDHIIRTGAKGVEFLAVNTDIHSLERTLSAEKLILGSKTTRGLGAGARPEVGAMAAIESREEIRTSLKGCNMVYLAAGMGGGTGTGALPVIADVAKEMGILTVSVVTRPFSFEGKRRTLIAEEGIQKVKGLVDALIVVPNDKLLELSERTMSLIDAFAMADDVLRQAVQGVTDIVTKPGMLNVDFADLTSVMKHAGGAVMGVGTASGEYRTQEALRKAMESPLMGCSIGGAKGVLLNISGDPNVGIMETQEAASFLQSQIDPDANFIWGWVPDPSLKDLVQIVLIATGFEVEPSSSPSRRERPDARSEPRPIPSAGRQRQPNARENPPRVGDALPQPEGIVSVETVYDTPSYLRRKGGK